MATGRNRLTTTIDKTGPFFTHNPGKTFRQNARVMLARIAEEGAKDLQAQLVAGQAGRQPISRVAPGMSERVSGHVIGRVRSLTGKPWQVTAVISVLNRGMSQTEAIALMAAGSEIEGRTHVFRRTTSRLRSARALNKAELLKGLQ